MKYALVVFLAASSCAFAQDTVKTNVLYQASGAGVVTAGAVRAFGAAVLGAPYSATITNESVQTLADGNRIIQNNSGTTARDSEGRTRQDAALPMLGNLSAANAPHIVFIMDPVAQISYTLNLTDKTAQKLAPSGAVVGGGGTVGTGPVTSTKAFFGQSAGVSAAGGPLPALPPPMFIQKAVIGEDDSQATTEDLGTQTMEGLQVTGVRTTRTIPAGEIGNEKPIVIVTEVWTSPDLKTVVYSKRSDPRMGEQIFKLTNITRAEPDASLFIVPADFRVTEGPQNFIYKMHQ